MCRAVSDCIPQVNQALEEISDRLEQAIIGTIPPSEVEEAQQDAVDLLSRLRQSHHQHEVLRNSVASSRGIILSELVGRRIFYRRC